MPISGTVPFSPFDAVCCTLDIDIYNDLSPSPIQVIAQRGLKIEMAKKANVTNRVIAYIREQIVSGAWPLGSKLPSENQLCHELGCSRISIRSALQQFIAIGAVESVHGKGSFLRSNDLHALDQPDEPVSYDELMDLLDFAQLAWPCACIQAAERDDAVLFQSLYSIVEQMRTTPSTQHEVLASLVYSFHQTIALSLSNNTLQHIFSATINTISRYPCTGNPSTVYYGSIYHHNLLLAAMKQKNPARIRMAVIDYITHIKHDFYQIPDTSTGESNATLPVSTDEQPL